jgi:RHS repeat-associated protein
VSLIYAKDVSELRDELNEALNTLHLDKPPFTDPTLVGVSDTSNPANATPVKAIHIRELRERLKGTIGSSCYKSIDQFVKDFYQGVLKRQPNSSELSSATSTLQSAQATSSSALVTAAQNLGTALFTSNDYASLGTSDDQFITDLYNGFLQRTEDTGGHNFWLGVLHSTNPTHTRADLIADFAGAGSPEFPDDAKALCRTAGGGSTTGSVHWMIADQLGTPRMIVDASGTLSGVSRHDYLPFGEELFAGTGSRSSSLGYTNADGARQKFTQKERDNETGLDYFLARYYSSTQGRFTGADPISLGVDRLFDPQRFNRYAYVRNNPLMFTDPDGRDIVLGSGDQKRAKKALVEIAKRPGGRELLTKLDKLTIQIIVSTGETKTGDYGRIGPIDPSKNEFVRHREDGKVTDVKGDPIGITLDFDRADKNRKENKERTENNKGMEAMGLPGKSLIPDVPKSDAELTGHELAHGENKFFGLPDSEASATGRIDSILAEPVDKNLAKDAEKFVDNLVQPNQPQPQSQPTPEPKKKPEDE